jgi:hypothetical protein
MKNELAYVTTQELTKSEQEFLISVSMLNEEERAAFVKEMQRRD